MKVFHSLSDTFRRRNKRERFVVIGGLLVVSMAVVGVNVVMPLIQRWRAREGEIALRREQLSRLHALVADEEALRNAVADLRAISADAGRVLLEGETPAVASSNLLRLLNQYADQSEILVDRVDFVSNGQSAAETPLMRIPAYVTARGDVFGLVDFLFYLQHGEKLLAVDELVVDAGRNGPGDLAALSWTIGLHGHYPVEAVP